MQWMLYVVWQKCVDNPDFRRLLLSLPSDAVIIEDSTFQAGRTATVWGTRNAELKAKLNELKKSLQAKGMSKAAIKREQDRMRLGEWSKVGVFEGMNIMGKILMACREALVNDLEPDIDYDLLRSKHIHLLGKELRFNQLPDPQQGSSELTLLEAVDTVAEKARGSELSNAFMKSVAAETALIAEGYGITPQQAVILASFLVVGPNRVDLDDLARHLCLSSIRVLKYGADLEELRRKRLLVDGKFDEINVSPKLITALTHNEAWRLPERKGLDVYEFFDVLDEMYSDLMSDDTTPELLYDDIQALLRDNPELDFVKQVRSLDIDTQEDWLLFLMFCRMRVSRELEVVSFRDMRDVFENHRDYNVAKRSMTRGDHRLMELGLVEHHCESGQASLNSFRLTDKVKETMLAELNLGKVQGFVDVSDLIEPKNLVSKELFFSKKLGRQVNELTDFLAPEKYNEIHSRMQQKGFRQGFACLFYGGPGTGKTETVYQLARATGRSIFMVNVAQIRSKWVGETERNIKAVFDRYREQVKRQELAPILFFNEADAIFNTRMNGAKRSSDKMENTMQNIVLQEMEQLDGILIATTNLERNLDSAFERRFLYKVRFDKPDEKVRAKIWKTMIGELSEKDARQLGMSFELSGGQIENVARKYSISSILHGESNDLLSELTTICREERITSQAPKRSVGFTW